MPEALTIVQLFDKSLSALGFIREGKRKRDQKTDQALFALYAALNETMAYIDERKSGKRRNRKREQKLALLWHHASVPVRYLDRDLARRCFLKGSYWLEPDVWSTSRIEGNRITIRNMLDSVRALIVG